MWRDIDALADHGRGHARAVLLEQRCKICNWCDGTVLESRSPRQRRTSRSARDVDIPTATRLGCRRAGSRSRSRGARTEDVMTRSIVGTGVLLLLWVAGPTGQQQPAAPPEPAHKVYVLTGCLEAGTATSEAFRLTGGSAVGEAPPPRASSSPARAGPGVYVLQPVSSVGEQGISRERLQADVGARVEVTVRPVEILPSTPSPSSANSADSKSKPEEAPPPRYNVLKINRLADSCT